MRAGNTINYFIPIKGEPPPTASRTINGKHTASDKRIEANTTPEETILEIPSSVRSDTGKFTLTQRYEFEDMSASATVNVLVKPGSPQGPLNTYPVLEDRVDLSWRTPQDNGGSEITGLFVEKRDKSSGGQWVSTGLKI